MKRFHFEALWQETGWLEKAVVSVDERGKIAKVESGTPEGAESIAGWALPGIPNAHSHAFQFALAGMAEHVPEGRKDDDFWSWRQVMYELALSVEPEGVQAIAAYAYSEMVARGFTSVAEFHYLHHQPDGLPYADPTVMAEALCRAANQAGIKLTLVPVHYHFGDFGKPASPRQRRFLFESADAYLKFATLCAAVAKKHGQTSGGGVHSLRASSPEETKAIFKALPKEWPRHLHLAEQKKEVDACVASLGKRPVTWALENLSLDERFHLVHATHSDERETRALAKSGANVVLCPTTEGNLGDGIFPLALYQQCGGRFSLGTDSHVGIDPWEELRLLEYGQRLTLQKRNPLCRPGESSGEGLLKAVVASGARAMGRAGKKGFVVGDAFDAVVIDASDPLNAALRPKFRIDTRVFAGGSGPLLGTLIDGIWVARAGRHLQREALATAARLALGHRR